MTAIEAITQRQARFDEYIGILASAVAHADRVAPLHRYCTGLLVPGERKSVEPMAARLDPRNVRSQHQSMHHFVSDSPWDDNDVLRAVCDYTLPTLMRASKDNCLVVDDSGIVKKGKASVGVARQYCGQLGKQENCQVIVSLSVANDVASLPVAHRLYLPEIWAKDPERRKQAKIPDDIEFSTKNKIALSQIQQAVAAGLGGPVLADAAYGNDTDFRDGITELGLPYAVGIQSTTTLWPPGIEPLPPPPYKGKGRPQEHGRRAPGHEPISAKAIAQGLSPKKFSIVRWRAGAKGTMKGRFAAVWVHPAHRDYEHPKTRPGEWLLIEWPASEKEPTKYWLSTMPKDTAIKTLVRLAKARWRIERDYQELKDEIGLDHYEGRGWRGFHHHATLCIAAYAFLMRERLFFPSGEIDRSAFTNVPQLPEDFRPRGATGTP